MFCNFMSRHLCTPHFPATTLLVVMITIIISPIVQIVQAGINERHLINQLLENYNVLERPVVNESDIVDVTFGIILQQIIDVDEKNQILIASLWLKVQWTDINLKWNPADYGGINNLRISPERVWLPDVLLYNSADERFDSTFRTNVVVQHDGRMLYVPPGVFKSTCKIDITWFPFDDQHCELKFGSWTYDGWTLDLIVENNTADTSPYIQNSEWVLVGVPAVKNTLQYDCCEEPFIDITYTVKIKRRTLYYGFNLIIPCIILSSMTLLGFSLPPESGEKLHLGVTILLSMTVFLVQLGKILPATSDSVSIIAIYFGSIMVMVAFSVVMTVVVLNFHHRSYETKEMGPWLKVVLLNWLPRLMAMDRPGIKPPKQVIEREMSTTKKFINILTKLFCGGRKIFTTPPTPTIASTAAVAAAKVTFATTADPHHPHHQYPYSPSQQQLTTMTTTMVPPPPMPPPLPPLPPPTVVIPLLSDGFIGTGTGTGTRGGVGDGGHQRYPPLPTQHQPSTIGGGGGGGGDIVEDDDLDMSISITNGLMPQQQQQQQRSQNDHYQPHHYHHHLIPPQHQESQPEHDSNDTMMMNHQQQQLITQKTSLFHKYIKLRRKHKLLEILLEMRFITDRLRKEDEIAEFIAEWRYAATVLDRICLVVFTFFTIFSLAICLWTAPQLIV